MIQDHGCERGAEPRRPSKPTSDPRYASSEYKPMRFARWSRLKKSRFAETVGRFQKPTNRRESTRLQQPPRQPRPAKAEWEAKERTRRSSPLALLKSRVDTAQLGFTIPKAAHSELNTVGSPSRVVLAKRSGGESIKVIPLLEPSQSTQVGNLDVVIERNRTQKARRLRHPPRPRQDGFRGPRKPSFSIVHDTAFRVQREGELKQGISFSTCLGNGDRLANKGGAGTTLHLAPGTSQSPFLRGSRRGNGRLGLVQVSADLNVWPLSTIIALLGR